MIRRATLDDMPAVLDRGATFLSQSPYAWAGLDREAFATFAARMIEDAGVIFLGDTGIIGGVLSPLYFNPGVLLAAELFWWAPTEGQALRQAFEAWAAEIGCVGVACSGLAGEREGAIRRIYERHGYATTEVSFMKRFG